MFILPVTVPSSKKIAHPFPISFQVPVLKMSTKGYQQIISPHNINTLPRIPAGDETTENHQVQGILLNPELPLREVDNKLGRIHEAKI